MEFFLFLAAVKMIALGAVYGRLDGGGIAKTSEWVERSLIMFFFVLACAPFAGYWSVLAYAGVIGIATGHGQYFLGLTEKPIKPEKVDIILRPLFGKDPRTTIQHLSGAAAFFTAAKLVREYGLKKLYWRCVAGMFVTGTLVGIPAAGICFAFNQYIPGALFLLTGAAKSLAYILGQKLWKSTEPAEYINGGLRNTICVFVLYLTASIICGGL